jgi:hypothetical protein
MFLIELNKKSGIFTGDVINVIFTGNTLYCIWMLIVERKMYNKLLHGGVKKLKSSKSLLMFTATQGCVTVKKGFGFPVPSRDVITKLSMAGESLASGTLFLQCR